MGEVVFYLEFKAVAPGVAAVVFTGLVGYYAVGTEAQSVGETYIKASKSRVNFNS